MEAATTTAPQPTALPGRRSLPPGPPLPRAAQTAIWSRQARRMLFACHERYGDIFTLKIAYEGTWAMLADPEAVKQVFTGDPSVYHAGEGNQILAPVLGRNSILVLDEKPHISQRRLLLPPFHGERMQGYQRTMSEIAATEIESWPVGTPYELRPRMQAITLDIILRTVFGVRDGERLRELREALRDFLDLTTNPRLLLPLLLTGPDRVRRLGPFRRRVDRVDRLIYREIAERRRTGNIEGRDDILSMLVGARHEDGSPMSDEEMRDELLTLLVAGHETTATSLAWAVERLSRHPQKLDRLRDEVEAGSEDYLTATIQETLRLRPVISTSSAASPSRSRSAATSCRRESRSPRPSISSIATRRSIPTPKPSSPSVSSTSRPVPTPGSPSAAASAVALAPRLLSSRWRWSSRSWSSAGRSVRQIPSPNASSAARSPRPRATTRGWSLISGSIALPRVAVP
jgi:cytochrome P450 family 135